MRENKRPNSEAILNSLSDITLRLDADALHLYLDELFAWNQSLGLISKREPERVAGKLIRLSVDLWDFVSNASDIQGTPRFIDIGSGGGFPGIIWKLLNPEFPAVLVERKEKKAVFLERTIKRLGLLSVDVIHADARDLPSEEKHREAYQLAVMLAVTTPAKMAGTVERILSTPGFFCSIRSGSEKIIDDAVGQDLKLRRALSSDEGIYVLYEKMAKR